MEAARPDIELLTQTADFVVKYGFLAVGLVLIFVIAPAIYKLAGAARMAIVAASFGLAFVVVYGVISIVAMVAPQWISSQRVMISGVVRGVPNGRQVQMKSDLWRVGNAYTKREFDPERENVFNFPFLLVTGEAPSCLALALVSTGGNDKIDIFNVAPVTAEDMANGTDLLAQFGQDDRGTFLRVWREVSRSPKGRATVYRPLDDTERGCEAAAHDSSFSIIGRAYAQKAPKNIVDRLQSDDAFTRRDARIDLSKDANSNVDLLGKLLQDDGNYRLQLGAAVAITAMPDDERKKLPTDVADKLRALRDAPDKTMRDTAVQALKEPAICYQEEDARRPPANRFLAMCYWKQADCERTRGPNTHPAVKQSACAPVQIAGQQWSYATGGYAGGWYQFSATVFGSPFPALP
jgi:hypothetical protein